MVIQFNLIVVVQCLEVWYLAFWLCLLVGSASEQICLKAPYISTIDLIWRDCIKQWPWVTSKSHLSYFVLYQNLQVGLYRIAYVM